MKKIMLVSLILTLVGVYTCEEPVEPVKVEFRFAEEEHADGLIPYTLPQTNKVFFLDPKVEMSNADIDSAVLDVLQDKTMVRLIFSDAGRDKFAQLTAEHLSERLAMLVNGNMVSAPIIRAPITQGMALIDGGYTREQAERIVAGINQAVKGD